MARRPPDDPVAPRVLRFPAFADVRGSLVAADAGSLPFAMARYFVIRDVPPNSVRGGHAQPHGHELITCVNGSCRVEVRWANGHEEHLLSDPRSAIHVPPACWVECRDFSVDAVVVVLCSDPYDPGQG